MPTADTTDPPDSSPSSSPGRWHSIIALDVRSLALFRVCLGLILLADLILRSRDLSAHYTDRGILRVDDLSTSWLSSLHAVSGSAWWQGILFGFAGAAAVALVLGLWTRVATFVSFLMLLSLHHRNSLILHGGDDLLRVLLFWSLFLPLGSYASLDRRFGWEVPPESPKAVSSGTAGFILQLCFLYWFSAILKSAPDWRTDGTAVYYALSLDMFATPFGQSLLSWPDSVLRGLTFSTLFLETLGPILLFLPVGTARVRILVVSIFVSFHLLGLGLALRLGIFPYVCAAAWLALLPGQFWHCWSRSSDWAQDSAWFYLPRMDQLLALVALLYVFLINVRTTAPHQFARIPPRSVRAVGNLVGLHQNWKLFAPRPLRQNGWYVLVATWDDGTQTDPFRGGEVVWEKPTSVSEAYRNVRWRKYLMNLLLARHEKQRQRFTRYIVERVNATTLLNRRVQKLKVYFVLEMTVPRGQTEVTEKKLLAIWPG